MIDLPPGWAWTTLGELGSWRGGGTPAKVNRAFWEGGTIPWLSPKDMGDSLLSGTQDRVTPAAIAESSISLIPANSVVIVVRSGILERTVPIALVPFETTLNQDMKAIVPHRGVDSRWLLYVLQAQVGNLMGTCRKAGTTVASLDTAKMQALPIPLPPVAEQYRIVEVLEDRMSRLDAAEAMLSSCVLRARVLSARAIDYSSSYRIDSTVGAAPPSQSDVVDGELPQLPASWSWSRLGEVAEVVGGIAKDSKRQSDESLALHPYLRVANVQAGYLDLDRITEIRATPAQVEKLTLHEGDVLLNEGGDRDKLGRGWIWEGQVPNCLHQNHVFRARVLDSVIDPRLVAWHANSFGRSWFMTNGKQSVNLASVSLATIRAFPVPVPPREMQGAIVERIKGDLEDFERLLGGISAGQSRCAALKCSLLRAAFNGELVDQDPSDEPAEVVLQRLRAQPKPVRKRAVKSSAAVAAQS